jgi:class 3 adenylate cyclase
MQNEKREIVAILFSDIKGYSQINNDTMLGKLKEHLNGFWERTLTQSNHNYFNSWGDAFLICSHSPIDLAEIALKLRDEFRNMQWEYLGFEDKFGIRIGLHVDSFNLIYDNGNVIDVYGKAVNKAARIEPIVDPNKVFCSKFYYDLLSQETLLNYKFENLGKCQLAKGWGAMELYELQRNTDTLSAPKDGHQSKFAEEKIKIRKRFTDQDLDDFLETSFENISDFFTKSCNELEAAKEGLSVRLKRVDAEKLKCTIYVNGEAMALCAIWMETAHSSRQLLISLGSTEIGGSYNDALYVDHDDFDVFLKSLGGFAIGEQPPEKMTPLMACQYLWERFINQLR